MKKKSHSVYSYINYRTFLKDFYESKKSANPLFSFRVFSRMAGFTSPNFLKLVILGKRNLSASGVAKVAKALSIKGRECDFFTALVNFNQSDLLEEKKKYYDQLAYFKEFNEVKKIDVNIYRYLSKWYHAAIRELVLLPNFREDPNWISRKLEKAITPEEALESLKLLEKLKLLKRDEYKKLKPTVKNLSTDPEIFDLSVSGFHSEMIHLAIKAIDKTPPEFRDISSVTVAVDKATFLEAKKRIRQFRRELNVLLSACKKPDSVYQLNFQIFNLTELSWPKKLTSS